MIKNKDLSKLDVAIYSLLVGGILGNMFDRIVYGYVVDFFDFRFFGYDFPVFNVADICIVVSVFLIICDCLRGYNNGN
jgi:signal peptidase II